ncbi:hypothetical protein J4446_01215 [Candidatus Woesearchaeota archaeon]|nr:hypothetical protein [Candidatus Woesearchaeota archaeon]
MKFKEVFEPVEKMDKYILRQYSKFVNKQEKKGRNRYELAKMFNPLITIPTIIAACFLENMGDKTNFIINFPVTSILMGFDIAENTLFAKRNDKNITEDGTITDDPFHSLNSKFRFPLIATSAVYGVQGATELINYFKTGDGLLMTKSLEDFMTSAYLFALSSSIYIKDANLKLLDKQYSLVEYLKKAGSKVKELVSPNPIPNPSPIQYYLLENRI